MGPQEWLLAVATRVGQTAIECSPTVLVGFIIAAILRRMIGAAGTRRLFGGEGIKGLLRAWFIGSLLPVCSLGAIPVAREMARAGVPWATVLAFVLAAPQLNPLSFLYGLTLSEPVVILCFVGSTMVLAILGGEIWKWFFARPGDSAPPGDEPMPQPGLGRLGLVFTTAARETIGSALPFILLAVVSTGILAGSIPHGALSNSMRHDSWWSTPLMTLVGSALYSGVLQGMMRIGLIFEHGNSTGAAFALFEVGVGLNIGLMVWLVLSKGWGRMVSWMALILGLVVLTGWVMDRTLYFAEEEASHTHAFDDWTSPYPGGAGASMGEVWQKWVQKAEVLEPVALLMLVLLGLTGLALRFLDRRSKLEEWLCRPPENRDRSASLLNRGVPGPVLGLVVLAGLVTFSVVALYIYYPASEDAYQEIIQVRADALTAVRTGKKQDAIRQLENWDLLTRKLQVGEFLRTGYLEGEKKDKAEALREELEEMRDDLLAGNLDSARERIIGVEKAHMACRKAFANERD